MKRLSIAVVMGMVLLAGCSSSPSINTTPASTEAQSAATTASSTTTAPARVAEIGDTVDVKKRDQALSASIEQVIDPAEYDDPYMDVPDGKRVVGIRFKLTNDSSKPLNQAISSTITLKDSNDQTYQDTYASLKGCPEFAGQVATLAPGESGVGCLSYEVPTAAKLVSATFSPDLGDHFARWHLG